MEERTQPEKFRPDNRQMRRAEERCSVAAYVAGPPLIRQARESRRRASATREGCVLLRRPARGSVFMRAPVCTTEERRFVSIIAQWLAGLCTVGPGAGLCLILD